MGRQAIGHWRPIGHTPPLPLSPRSRPLALVGEPSPPMPVARSTDSNKILPSHSLNTHHQPSTEEINTSSGTTTESTKPPEEAHKLIASIPDALLASLRSTCAAKAEVSLLGRIHGKHPGLKNLTAWARATLHSSLSLLSLNTNNLFEVTFAQPEGRIHALTQADLVCDGAAIYFSSCRPHFDSKAPEAEENLDHPVWVQIVDLCQVLREESFLRIIGEQLGQVISIDNSDAYRAKLFGPRIRLLVQDLHQLPQTVVIPRLDGEGTVEYKLEFSGLPKQCGRCRAHDHLVRNCPRHPPPASKIDGSRSKGQDPQEAPPQESVAVSPGRRDNTVQRDEPPEPQKGLHTPSPDNPGSPEQVAQPSIRIEDTGIGEAAEAAAPQEMSRLEILRSVSPKNIPDSSVDPSISMLQPDDINFPRLPTPTVVNRGSPNTTDTPHFVWKTPNTTTSAPKSQPLEGSKGKGKLPESAPLTRQGYRTGRLAEDFWTAIDMPNTPTANPKMLRVIPFLTKNRHLEQAEYLIDRRGPSFGVIAYVYIAELLAGIPWTQSRARQHVVNEVSQALHKILIFNNNLSNPFQRCMQGRWYAHWDQGAEGEHICTLFVSIDAPEHKIKPRKGFQWGWRKEPVEVTLILASTNTEEIQVIKADHSHWQRMAGRLPLQTFEQPPPESHNRFASLLEDVAAL